MAIRKKQPKEYRVGAYVGFRQEGSGDYEIMFVLAIVRTLQQLDYLFHRKASASCSDHTKEPIQLDKFGSLTGSAVLLTVKVTRTSLDLS